VKRTTDIFRGQIVDVNQNTYTIQLVGPSVKLVAFIDALDGNQVVEVVRSGVSGIGRGDRILSL
jgi:acetolactate synthase-1/3 small subunit